MISKVPLARILHCCSTSIFCASDNSMRLLLVIRAPRFPFFVNAKKPSPCRDEKANPRYHPNEAAALLEKLFLTVGNVNALVRGNETVSSESYSSSLMDDEVT